MFENKHALIHTFGALADLGQAVTDKNNFQETIKTSLHLISGALAIMRGGVARYSRYAHELNMVAARGLGEDFPLSLTLSVEAERQFLASGLYPIEVASAGALPFFHDYDSMFLSRKIELFVPLVIRSEMVGALLLGEKATGLPYSSYEKEIICAMARHIGVAIGQRNLVAEVERRADENRKLY